jgi:hypothetical protein
MSNAENWPFDQTPETAVMTTIHVLDQREPIRYVIHYDHDDSWAFLCGTTNLSNDYRMIHMAHVLELDSSLQSVADLPSGWSAWREDGESPWERFQEEFQEES